MLGKAPLHITRGELKIKLNTGVLGRDKKINFLNEITRGAPTGVANSGREREILFYGKRFNNHSFPIQLVMEDRHCSIDTLHTFQDNGNRKSIASFIREKTLSLWTPNTNKWDQR